MSDSLGAALMLAFDCIHKTIEPYIGEDFNMRVEAEVHTKVNENLKKIESSYEFSAETIFDYDTREFVTTLNAKGKGGIRPDRTVKLGNGRVQSGRKYMHVINDGANNA